MSNSVLEQVKHFHDTEMKCSAIVVDWAKLDKLNNEAENFLDYLGNYMDDDSNSVWALFGDFPKRYCILIEK